MSTPPGPPPDPYGSPYPEREPGRPEQGYPQGHPGPPGGDDLAAALRFSPRRVLPLLGWGILAGLMTVIGSFLLLLPGLYLMIVFVPTLHGVVIIERAGIGRCFTLVHNRFWPTAGRVLLVLVALVVVYVVLVFAVVLPLGPGSVLTTIIDALVGIAIGIVATAFVVVSYAELRFHDREGPGALTPTLAAELRQ